MRTYRRVALIMMLLGVVILANPTWASLETASLRIPDTEPVETVAEHDVFRSGEKIRLRVSYLGFTAGYLETKLGNQNINGRPVYTLQVTGKSSGLAHWFYTIRDRFVSYVDPTGYFSLGYDYHQNHDGEKEFDSVRYDHDRGVFFNNGDTEAHGSFPPFSQDVLSALYYIRAQDLSVGQYYQFPVHLDDEAYHLEIYVEGKETVATSDRGWVETFRIRPSLKDPEKEEEFRKKLKNNQNGVRIWITADKHKIPVQIAVPAKIGSFWAYLDQYSPGRQAN